MTTLDHVRIDGRVGYWYEIDRDDNFILFESETYGDEAGHILTDYDLREITETWDSIEDTLVDLGMSDADEMDNLEMGFDPYLGCCTDDC